MKTKMFVPNSEQKSMDRNRIVMNMKKQIIMKMATPEVGQISINIK